MKTPKKRDYPHSLNIKGQTWAIAWVDQIEGKSMVGLTDFNNRVIYLKNGEEPGETFATFWHEVLHAAAFEANLKLRHKDIYALEHIIANVVLTAF